MNPIDDGIILKKNTTSYLPGIIRRFAMKNLIPLLIIMFLLSGCSLLQITCPMEASIINEVEVRPPVLKYSLISSLEEIYLANVLVPEKWSEYYEDADSSAQEHYQWLKDTYAAMDEDMKDSLVEIFENVSDWKLMDLSTKLSDSCTLDDILTLYNSAIFELPYSVRQNLKKLLPYYYENFFRDYFERHVQEFEELAEALTLEAQNYENPYEFIERMSGIELGDYACLFYFTFKKVGAYGFSYGNLKISTLQRNVTTIEKLYFTPLHEYSHAFFRTFTNSDEFEDLAEKLKNDTGFYDFWRENRNLTRSYPWRSFCEENLVEGFAKFLREKLYEEETHVEIYYYDLDFYLYLKEIDYNPGTMTLKDVSLDFYRQKLSE
ncbi:MAG: hypothetical protein PWQ27_1072 [Kosmotoga sp.]|nr:hypothetical protein [Kosmotoga sp.]